jgi:hypothetical protein
MKSLAIARPISFPVRFGKLPCTVGFEMPREEVHQWFGPPHRVEVDDGLGTADWWAFAYPCGLEILVEYLHYPCAVGVFADSPEIEHVLRHIPVPIERCQTIDDAELKDQIEFALKREPHLAGKLSDLHAFQVWRVDDNGNVFKVGEPTSERDAKCWAAELESYGHKQLYWLAPVGQPYAVTTPAP